MLAPNFWPCARPTQYLERALEHIAFALAQILIAVSHEIPADSRRRDTCRQTPENMAGAALHAGIFWGLASTGNVNKNHAQSEVKTFQFASKNAMV